TIKIWDVAPEREVMFLRQGRGGILSTSLNSAAVSRDGSMGVSGSSTFLADGMISLTSRRGLPTTITLTDPQDAREPDFRKRNINSVDQVALSADGGMMAAAVRKSPGVG